MSETMPARTAEQMALGEALRRLRMRQGLTQEEAADAAGVTQQTWQRYEKGKRRLTTDQLERLAAAVGSSQEELMMERARFLGQPTDQISTGMSEKRATGFIIPIHGRGRAGPRGAHLYDINEPEAELDLTRHYGPTTRAMQLIGDSVYPWASSGTTIIYDLQLWPRRGQGCLIELNTGEKFVKIFLKVDDQSLFVQEMNTDQDDLLSFRTITFDLEEVRGVYAVKDRIE